jgi:hypothetical protein
MERMIPPIDIAANAKYNQEMLALLLAKYNALLDKIEPMEAKNERSWEYFDHMISLWYIQHCIQQKSTDPIIPQFDASLMYVLDKKLEWVNSGSPNIYNHTSHVKFIREKYLTALYIKEGYYGANAPRDNSEYENVLIQELDVLESMIGLQIDDHIRIFYIKQELKTRNMAKNKTITKQQSDQMINDKVKDYDYIIALLRDKTKFLEKVISETSDSLLKVNTKLEIIKLQREIESKLEFWKRYVERKNIIS